MKILSLVLLMILSGCASLQNAGIFSVEINPQTGVTKLVDGKQYASIKGNITFTKNGDYITTFEAMDAQAFQGQAIAAGATQVAATSAAKAAVAAALVGTAPMLIPAIGGIAATGGLGAAAVGAGSVVAGSKIFAPTKGVTPSIPTPLK